MPSNSQSLESSLVTIDRHSDGLPDEMARGEFSKLLRRMLMLSPARLSSWSPRTMAEAIVSRCLYEAATLGTSINLVRTLIDRVDGMPQKWAAPNPTINPIILPAEVAMAVQEMQAAATEQLDAQTAVTSNGRANGKADG